MRGVYQDGIYTKHEDEQQQLRLGGGSWSINLEELPADAKLIEYITPSASYVVSREDALKHGFVKILGGEKKLCVPVKIWQKDAVAINE